VVCIQRIKFHLLLLLIKTEVVDHQRLSGAGYCFSASAPPFLSKVCVASVKRLEGNLEEIHKDFRTKLKENEYEKLETEISGSQLLNKLRDNISNLYGTLTNSSHPYALKLRNRLVITSHPQSPILYLCLSDQQATGLTRNEQASVLDRIAHHCLVEGEVAVVSTGRHVKKYLQVVPDPCLRVTANTSQTKEDVEKLVKALGEAVEAVLCRNVFGLDIIDED
jgi:serine palmitoyltransferase